MSDSKTNKYGYTPPPPPSSYQSTPSYTYDSYKSSYSASETGSKNVSSKGMSKGTQNAGQAGDLDQYNPQEISMEFQAALKSGASHILINGKVYPMALVAQWLQANGVGVNPQAAAFSGGAQIPPPPGMMAGQDPILQKAFAFSQELKNQGLSDQQVHQKLLQGYGNSGLGEAELRFMAYGSSGYTGEGDTSELFGGVSVVGKGMGSGSYGSGIYGQDQYGMMMMENMMMKQMTDKAKDKMKSMKNTANQEKMKMHMILLQILMGDFAGALRSYVILAERDNRAVFKDFLKKLEKVRSAKGLVIRSMGTAKYPKATVSQSPEAQARNAEKAAEFNQMVQVNTQFLSEIQNTEREILDAMNTVRQEIRQLWESYSNMRDLEWRITDRVNRVQG